MDAAMREGLARHRRSLLATSLLLIFYRVAGLQIDQVGVMGGGWKIGNPQAVPAFLALLWAYFLVRYYQFFREADRGILSRWQNRFDEQVARSLERKLRRSFEPDPEDPGKARDLLITRRELVVHYRSLKLWVARIRFDVAYRTDATIRSHQADHQVERTVHGRALWLPALRAGADVARDSHLITEFWLPFAVALAAPVVFLWPWICRGVSAFGASP